MSVAMAERSVRVFPITGVVVVCIVDVAVAVAVDSLGGSITVASGVVDFAVVVAVCFVVTVVVAVSSGVCVVTSVPTLVLDSPQNFGPLTY